VGQDEGIPSSNRNKNFYKVSIFLCDGPIKMAYCEIKGGVGVGATWEEAPLKLNKRMNTYPKR
jgi:hypothetical protein